MAETILNLAVGITVLAVFIGGIRLALGPTTIDRVVAMDAITIITIPLVLFVAHVTSRFIYVDVAIVYALLSFLGVLSIARFTEGGV